MVYLMNSPIVTDWGVYKYSPISVEEAVEVVKGGFVSAIGHESTASFLSSILKTPVPMNRIQVKMEKGDIAIIFRILTRLPEGKVLTEDEIRNIPYEIGLLEKVE